MSVLPKLPIYNTVEVFVYDQAEFMKKHASAYINELDTFVDQIAERLNTVFETTAEVEYYQRKGLLGTGFGIFEGIANHFFEIPNELRLQISNEFYSYTDNNVQMSKWSVMIQVIYHNYDAYHTASPVIDCFLSEVDNGIHELHNIMLADYKMDRAEECEDYSNDV
jgi:hypothetical protein